MAEQKIKYGSYTSITITLASLASDTNLVAGRESNVIDNSSNLVIDHLISGKLRLAGSGLTADRQVDIWVVPALSESAGTPTYPDVFDGTDSNETVTSANVRNGLGRLLASLRTDSTASRDYFLAPTSVAALFGGVLPRFYVLFIVHNTGNNFDATGGNFAFGFTPITYTVA